MRAVKAQGLTRSTGRIATTTTLGRTFTLAVAVIWACASWPLRAQMTDLERQRLVAHMDMTSAWLVDEVAGLSDTQLRFRPTSRDWSIAQILEHLVVVAPIYWQDLQAAVRQPPRKGGSAMTDASVLWYGIDRRRREQAIPSELPPKESRDFETTLGEYRKHHERLLQYVRTTGDDLRSHFVERQQSDAYQWALLISTHEQRHILQIRENKAHPGFPR